MTYNGLPSEILGVTIGLAPHETPNGPRPAPDKKYFLYTRDIFAIEPRGVHTTWARTSDQIVSRTTETLERALQ